MYYDNISNILRDGFKHVSYKLLVNFQGRIHDMTEEQFICTRQDTAECETNCVTCVLFDEGDSLITLDMLKAKQPELIDIQRFEVLREYRNTLLKETDYLFTSDYPHTSEMSKENWKMYRQTLRDLPQTQNPQIKEDGTLDVESIVLPEKPT